MRFYLLPALLAACLLVATPLYAVSATVVDENEKPIQGAVACYMLPTAEGLCVETDEKGSFTLPDSGVDRIRIRADGYLPEERSATTLSGTVKLATAAELLIRVEDSASGEVLSRAELWVIFPGGRRVGPFPSSRGGVKLATLEPGTYRLIGALDGFAQQRAISVVAVAGKLEQAVVPLAPIPTEE